MSLFNITDPGGKRPLLVFRNHEVIGEISHDQRGWQFHHTQSFPCMSGSEKADMDLVVSR
jgi:hypothetical protein